MRTPCNPYQFCNVKFESCIVMKYNFLLLTPRFLKIAKFCFGASVASISLI